MHFERIEVDEAHAAAGTPGRVDRVTEVTFGQEEDFDK